jgi:hypothetical protein
MATSKSTAKKAPARKRKLSPNTKLPPPGFGKYTFNFPEKLVKQFKAEALRRVKNGTSGTEDGRYGYQSLMRQVLEAAAAKFKK